MDRTSRGDVMSVDEDSLEEKERAEVETTLDRLRCGARGQVTTYHQGFDPQRYLEMGLTPGTEVEVVRYAPLGDPLEIRVRGYALSIRKDDASRIGVLEV